MLEIVEDENYYFDAVAADRPCRFIEKYCILHEGRQHAGKPFLLHPLQKKAVRDIYGWKHRITGLRRFTDVWFEAAVGAGKSPLLAALGLFNLGYDGEVGAQVFSLAANFQQAATIFNTAKKFVELSPDLSRVFRNRQYDIQHRKTGSIWKIISGKGPKAGKVPSTVLADEIHEFKTREVYDSLRDRDSKREQPLFFCATNAGESQVSFCYHLHEKAIEVLETNGLADPSFYPIVWAAPEDCDFTNPEMWRLANPLIGTTISEGKVKKKCQEAMLDDYEKAKFKRLYLSLWPKTTINGMFDMGVWDGACKAFDYSKLPDGTIIYVGLDMSHNNDLSSVIMIYATPDGHFYVTSHFWMPRFRAEEHEQKFAVPYTQWEKDGDITLVDGPTIDAHARVKIAEYILSRGKTHKIKVIAYDRARAEEVVAILDAAGQVCLGVPQGWSLHPGCEHMDRRLAEKTITIHPSGVLKFCAQNAEREVDKKGNVSPRKPNAKQRYAGTIWKKIDGVSALVTGMVEARKHAYPNARAMWKGKVSTLATK